MSKITINLYLEDLKPKKELLTAKNVLLATILSAALMVAAVVSIWNMTATSQRELERVNLALTSSQQQLQELQQALIRHNDSAQVNNLKMDLQQQLKAREMLWESIGQRLQTSRINYFELMNELTLHHNHELWLDSFLFDKSNVSFSGHALNSKAVTQWMTFLQSSPALKGREFGHLSIKAVNDEVLSFDAATVEPMSSEQESGQ